MNFKEFLKENSELRDYTITFLIGELIEKEKTPEDEIQELKHTIELLKKDVRYYADMADSRLQTIEVQSKLITALEGK